MPMACAVIVICHSWASVRRVGSLDEFKEPCRSRDAGTPEAAARVDIASGDHPPKASKARFAGLFEVGRPQRQGRRCLTHPLVPFSRNFHRSAAEL